jgi:hypothetical protein
MNEKQCLTIATDGKRETASAVGQQMGALCKQLPPLSALRHDPVTRGAKNADEGCVWLSALTT